MIKLKMRIKLPQGIKLFRKMLLYPKNNRMIKETKLHRRIRKGIMRSKMKVRGINLHRKYKRQTANLRDKEGIR